MTEHEARQHLAQALEKAERIHRIVGQELARYRVKAQVGHPTPGLADAAEEASRALEDIGADLDTAFRAHDDAVKAGWGIYFAEAAAQADPDAATAGFAMYAGDAAAQAETLARLEELRRADRVWMEAYRATLASLREP